MAGMYLSTISYYYKNSIWEASRRSMNMRTRLAEYVYKTSLIKSNG